MGRPPSNGNPTFRFNPIEVGEMETILQEHHALMPAREVLESLAEKFSNSAERSGKIVVQMKQVWNWFQNRRYAIRAKAARAPGKLSVSPMPREESTLVRNVSQAPQSLTVLSVQSAGRSVSDNSQMEFEAKSARDGAWYDVLMFLSHRSLETGEPDVLVRFSGFGSEEDEWINVLKHVRPRSLPCESSECVVVLQGDLVLCFQEGKEQALYFDAHVLDAQRRRHDVRGCRCRFLVRYDHDQSEEIVPLRKVCRRPETDYRLHQLHSVLESVSVNHQKNSAGTNSLRVYPPTETSQKVEVVPPASHVSTETKVLPPEHFEISTTSTVGTPVVPPTDVALTSGLPPKSCEISTSSNDRTPVVPPQDVALTSDLPPESCEISTASNDRTPVVPPQDVSLMSDLPPKSCEITTVSNDGTTVVPPQDFVLTSDLPLKSCEISTASNDSSPAPGDDVALTSGLPPESCEINTASNDSSPAPGDDVALTSDLPPKSCEISTASNDGTPIVPPPDVALTSGDAPNTITVGSGQNTPQAQEALVFH